MVKTRNNEDLLKKLEYPLLKAQRRVEEIELKIDNIKRDILDPPVICCNKKFISNSDLRNHTKSVACKNKAEPMVKCTMCRNKFYGLTKGEATTLGLGNGKFDNSTYGKHYRKCFSCIECGELFKSYKEKKEHLHFMPCRVHLCNTTEESEVSDNELIMEINDRPDSSSSTSSAEYEEWNYNNISYGVDNDNNVFDEYGNNVGSRYKDDLTEDWMIDYE